MATELKSLKDSGEMSQFSSEDSQLGDVIYLTDIKKEPENEWFSDSTDSADEPPAKVPRLEPENNDYGHGRLPVPGKFMPLNLIFRILKSTEKVLKAVPLGEKNNVFFVIEDKINTLWKRMNMKTNYHDDCGVWDCHKGNTANTYVTFSDGNLKTGALKDGLFCSESRKNGVSSWIPLDPQPDRDAIVKVHRYYTTLKGDSFYKRRITCVLGGDFSDRMVVEYAGVRTGPGTIHGNSKSAKEYIRTSPSLLEKISEEVKNKSSKQVYTEMLRENELGVPRSLKQVVNVKYRAAKKLQQEKVVKVAHENHAYLTMLEENQSVQAVIHRKDKAPCVILHSDEQLNEMKSNLESESTLGVDRTYKVGDCYITLTLYQNFRAVHEESRKPTLYLGPVFLHWDIEFRTYISFFSYLVGVLEDMKPNFEVKLGDEMELTLFNALENCFPSSVQMLNCQHFQESVNKKLFDILEDESNKCFTIMQKMFGSKGMVSSPSLSVFESKVLELSNYFSEFPNFKNYFDELQPLLYSYICEPQQKGITPKLWANSNSEAINGFLKLTLRSRPHELPDLVEKICTVSRLQMLDLKSMA